MDTGFNIKTTSDNAAIVDFVNKVNSGKMTVKELSTATKELKASLIAGSQAQKEFGDITYQVARQSKSAEAQERSLTDVIKTSRKERRMYMFAVNESMAAMTAIIGKEDNLTKSIAQGAQAVFGMQFALQALGGTFAQFALPVALIVGLITVVKQLFFNTAEEAKNLAEKTKEASDKFKEWAGLIAETRGLKESAGEGNYAVEAQKLERLKNALQDATVLWKDYQRTGEAATTEGLKAEKDYLVALQNVSEQEAHIAKIKEDDAKKTDESNKKSIEAHNKKRAALIEEQDYQYAIKNITDAEYLTILKIRWAQADIVHSRKEELAVMGQIAAFIAKHPELNPVPITQTGHNFGTVPKINFNPGEIDISAFKTPEQVVKERAEKEQQATQDYLIEPLQTGFRSVAYSALDGFNRMWEQSSGFARTVLGQAFEAIADDILSKLEVKGAESLLSLIPGLGFLAHAEGGWLNEPVVGIGMSTGRIHTFAEKQPEYISTMSQMSRSSSGSGNMAMARAIQSLADKIIPASMNEVNTLIIKQNNLRGKRIMSPTQ